MPPRSKTWLTNDDHQHDQKGTTTRTRTTHATTVPAPLTWRDDETNDNQINRRRRGRRHLPHDQQQDQGEEQHQRQHQLQHHDQNNDHRQKLRHDSVTERQRSTVVSTSASRTKRPRHGLRMGLHGWTGTLSTMLTIIALITHRESIIPQTEEDPSVLYLYLAPSIISTIMVVLIAITAVTTAQSGLNLIHHAPISTVIWKSTVTIPSWILWLSTNFQWLRFGVSGGVSISSNSINHTDKGNSNSSTTKSSSSSSIILKVVPPHRDAFRRTATSVYYLCSRLVFHHHVRPWLLLWIRWCVERLSSYNNNNQYLSEEQLSTTTITTTTIMSMESIVSQSIIDWMWGIALVWFVCQKFIPHPTKDVEWSNGNTYVFVIPMAAGIAVDAFFQLPYFQCIPNLMFVDHHHVDHNHDDHDDEVVTKSTTSWSQSSFSSSQSSTICWNDTIVTEFELLAVLLSALIVAFVFTLAFRGLFNLKHCYWMSAMVVHGICLWLIIKGQPFILSSLLVRLT